MVMEGLDHPILVIGPLRVVGVTWPDEFYEWDFACTLSYRVIRDDGLVARVNEAGIAARSLAKIQGTSPELTKALVEDARRNESKRAVREMVRGKRSCVHLINQEQVEFLVEAWGKDWPYKTVFIDESSSLKDHKTNRWKALWKVRQLITRMHQLTATDRKSVV